MIEIREYRETDFKEVSFLLEEAFSIKKAMGSSSSSLIEIVACMDEKVVGYLLLTKVLDPVLDHIYFLVDYVCVKKEYQNQKIGGQLIEKSIDIATGEGASYLQLSSSRFRVAARKLYQNYGFVIRESDIFRKVIK